MYKRQVDNIIEKHFIPDAPHLCLHDYNLHSFVRDPMWPFNVMEKILIWLEQKEG